MYSASIEIAATPSQVFTWITDPGLLKQWHPEIVEVKRPEGGLRVGATAQVLVKEFGRRFSVEFVVVAVEPSARFAYHMTAPMSGHIEYVLTHRHDGTGLSLRIIPDEPNGGSRLIARAISVLTRPLVQRKLRSQLAALRRVVEAKR